MSNEIDDLFAPPTAGAPSAKLSNIGDSVQGVIYRMERQTEKDDDGNEVLNEWGKPKPVFVAHLITALRDPANPDDDGSRRVWMKGNALWTFKEFLKVNNIRAPKVGGRLKLTVSGLKPATSALRKPQKLHDVMYAVPTPDLETQAYAWAKKKEDEKNSQADEDFFGGSQSSTPASRTTTLDSMRTSGGFEDDVPPF